MKGIDAKILVTADDPPLPQGRDGLAIPPTTHVREAGYAANRLFTLGGTPAPEQVGDPLLGDDVGDVIAIDHDGREIELQLFRHRDAVERLDEIRLQLLDRCFAQRPRFPFVSHRRGGCANANCPIYATGFFHCFRR
jgi:hypothetical protein